MRPVSVRGFGAARVTKQWGAEGGWAADCYTNHPSRDGCLRMGVMVDAPDTSQRRRRYPVSFAVVILSFHLPSVISGNDTSGGLEAAALRLSCVEILRCGTAQIHCHPRAADLAWQGRWRRKWNGSVEWTGAENDAASCRVVPRWRA